MQPRHALLRDTLLPCREFGAVLLYTMVRYKKTRLKKQTNKRNKKGRKVKKREKKTRLVVFFSTVVTALPCSDP